MATPENRLKAWQIVERNLDPDNPHIKLADSIARAIESAQEEGYRSAFLPPMQQQAAPRDDSFAFWYILALIAGFAGLVATTAMR